MPALPYARGTPRIKVTIGMDTAEYSGFHRGGKKR